MMGATLENDSLLREWVQDPFTAQLIAGFANSCGRGARTLV